MACDCVLVGTIPADLAGLSRLQKLLLGYNALTRAIPQHFASNDLTGIWLEHNNLRGPMPSISGTKGRTWTSTECPNDAVFDVQPFEGSIPDDLSELEFFEVMEISDNEMSGALPSWLKELDFVELTHNQPAWAMCGGAESRPLCVGWKSRAGGIRRWFYGRGGCIFTIG